MMRSGEWNEKKEIEKEMKEEEWKEMRMIEGGRKEEKGIFICCLKGFGNKIEGKEKIVGEKRSKVLEFKKNMRKIFKRKIIVELKWSLEKERENWILWMGKGFEEGGNN